MNDPNNSRQILPSTVSSATGTGPAAPARARVSVACESCKRKKCKCTGGHPCEACQNSDVQCVFDETQDKRRKVYTKRTIDDLTFEVQVFRTLQKAIRNDTHEHAFEQIRRRASTRDIATALRDLVSDEGDDAESADADLILHDSDFPGTLLGQPVQQRRRLLSAGSLVDPLLQTDTSNSDSMDLDRPPTAGSNGGDMRLLQERSYYQKIVKELENGTDEEAEELFRQLRASMGLDNLYTSRLPTRHDGQSTLGNLRTLPEISTSIRTPRNIWYERDGSGNGPPLSTTSSHAAQKSTTNVSTQALQAVVSPSYQSGSVTGPGLAQYITSAHRQQRESGRSANKVLMVPK